MKIKLFYFIISCIFAIVTSANSKIDIVHSQFKENGKNILLLEIQESKTKDYTLLLVDKIEPENNLNNRLRSRFEFFYEDVFSSKIKKEFDKINNEIEIINVDLPYYTILYRYKNRVLRI